MHNLMNSSFVALGALTLIGAYFLHRHIRSGREKKWILSLAVIIAISTAATGLFPANDGTIMHWVAVLPGFVARHVVLALIAWHLWNSRRIVALWAGLCALVGVVGAVLMLAQTLHFGLGERLALYPMPTWMAVTGAAVLFALARRTVLERFDFSWIRLRPGLLHRNHTASPRYTASPSYTARPHSPDGPNYAAGANGTAGSLMSPPTVIAPQIR